MLVGQPCNHFYTWNGGQILRDLARRFSGGCFLYQIRSTLLCNIQSCHPCHRLYSVEHFWEFREPHLQLLGTGLPIQQHLAIHRRHLEHPVPHPGSSHCESLYVPVTLVDEKCTSPLSRSVSRGLPSFSSSGSLRCLNTSQIEVHMLRRKLMMLYLSVLLLS